MPALEAIEGALAARGYRLTPARRAVLQAILSRAEHFTAEEVMRQTSAGRATVFRTVRLLCDMGILCRVLLEDGRLHYRLSDHRHHHHHLVCMGCGRVQDLEECAVGGLVRELARSTGYEIQGHWLEFYGRCLSCRQSDDQRGEA
ncbi:MAG: transcriptional repressor [Dehalococcoidia bacterium]|jgi:Fur family ferric uptake transcriptional regulator|nr:transcriptional repressor [Dehalococcoidia bacterium]MDW8008633.1 transcriptional repressor [Chloroflexota bacterium]